MSASAPLVAFGAFAERWASGMNVDVPAIVFDQSGIGEAISEALRRKAKGETVFARPILPTEPAARMESVLPSLMSSFPSADERRIAFDEAARGTLLVNSRPLNELSVYGHAFSRMLGAVLRLCDGVIASSHAERRRIVALSRTDPAYRLTASRDPWVPVPRSERRSRNAIVLWAPHLPPAAVAAYALPFAGLRHPAVSISSETTSAAIPEILAQAAVIVDLASHGCDSVAALVEWGVPLVCDIESGGSEIAEPLRTFERGDSSTLFAAVVAALGLGEPRVRRANGASTAEPLTTSGPLVSVILPTFDRPKMLRRAIESVRRQSYDNIELIVVNDGGPSIDDLVAEYPGTHLLAMPENKTFAAMNSAFNATAGEYICFLNDDDIFLPDHVARLAGALICSGGRVANADVLTATLEGQDDHWTINGFESNMSRPVDPDELLVANQIAMISTMFRRDCVSEPWLLDPEIPFYRDYAFWLRLALRYDFIHVERITACYTIRNRGAAQASVIGRERAVGAYRAIYARFPVDGRPSLKTRREATIESLVRGEMGLQPDPAVIVTPAHWPPWEG